MRFLARWLVGFVWLALLDGSRQQPGEGLRLSHAPIRTHPPTRQRGAASEQGLQVKGDGFGEPEQTTTGALVYKQKSCSLSQRND